MTIRSVTISRPLVPVRIKSRWYSITHSWSFEIVTDCGRVVVSVAEGFLFDGRSGGPAIDWLVPNLGTTAEVWAWAVHDVLGHGVYGGFEFTNDTLHWILRNLAGYSKLRAGMVYNAVSLSGDWYGEPEPCNRSYPNLALIHVRHYAK